MRQQTLADNGFERFRKRTRREIFLLEMDEIIPWRDLCKVIKLFYPKLKCKGGGRPPVGLERMLRIHFVACGLVQLVHGAQTIIATHIGQVRLEIAAAHENRV